MNNIKIKAGNSVKSFKAGTSLLELAKELDAKGALAAKVNSRLVDLSAGVTSDSEIEFITFESKEGKEVFWHSASHILAQAVTELFPETTPTIGPAIENGFYYDFDRKDPFRPDDLKQIHEKMREIVKRNLLIERADIPKDQALAKFGGNPYKFELIGALEGPVVSYYKQGDFVDLCRGPHVPSTGYIKAFKLVKIAGAYWKGDSKNRQLQRIYGIAFPDKQMLKDHLTLIEEAKKRDHRKLGQELDLYSFHDEGAGFPFFHPKGMALKNVLLEFWREQHARAGYVEISTPTILTRNLWEQSGHWDHYRENMYFTKIDDIDYAIKPMNCPGGILVYKTKKHSYRELPLKVGEIGLVHRHELSGVLAGLFRVRAFTQDDAHIFMLPGQIKAEIINVINLTDSFYRTFGFEYHVELSTMPPGATDDKKLMADAEEALKDALKEKNLKFTINEGEGAFYGPKIDFHLKDCLGRTWQCGTIQLDFLMPERFDLTYMGEDGTENHRPVMLHRVIYGSLERFIGILVEHYAGKFPLWLSPEQVRIISVADRFSSYANLVRDELAAKGLRATSDVRSESVSRKVREAQLQKINYILVVGEREEKDKTVAIRTRKNEILGDKSVADFVKDAMKEIREKVS
ncbi:MAG: threonine--tRNA ligase [archaeon]